MWTVKIIQERIFQMSLCFFKFASWNVCVIWTVQSKESQSEILLFPTFSTIIKIIPCIVSPQVKIQLSKSWNNNGNVFTRIMWSSDQNCSCSIKKLLKGHGNTYQQCAKKQKSTSLQMSDKLWLHLLKNVTNYMFGKMPCFCWYLRLLLSPA